MNSSIQLYCTNTNFFNKLYNNFREVSVNKTKEISRKLSTLKRALELEILKTEINFNC